MIERTRALERDAPPDAGPREGVCARSAGRAWPRAARHTCGLSVVMPCTSNALTSSAARCGKRVSPCAASMNG
eukprot:7998614-Lingulodinium_polyedra.AAC.1